MAQPPVPFTTNTGGKVAGVSAVLLMGLEIRGHAYVCRLSCCFVQNLGVCWNWWFAELSEKAPAYSWASKQASLQPVTGLTRLVPDTKGWPSSRGGWVNRPGTDRMQHFLLDQVLYLWSLSSFFPILSVFLIKAIVSLSKLCLAFITLVCCSYSAANGMWLEKVASLSYFFSFIPGHLLRGRIKVVWVLRLRTANVTLHFPNF